MYTGIVLDRKWNYLPNMRRPEVSLSSLWMVLRFFRLYSLARMNTTVLCL